MGGDLLVVIPRCLGRGELGHLEKADATEIEILPIKPGELPEPKA
jgi:hypothetical protein